MRRQGFTLQSPPVTPPTLEVASGAGAAEISSASYPSSLLPSKLPPKPQQSHPSVPTGAAGASLALRDLRDAFIATMKPPVLPPWFLGPVEGAASVGGAAAGKRALGTAAARVDAGAAGAASPSGRGVTLRTTQAVAPGELLAVSLPLAICYCRQGTTPENEDLTDVMLFSVGDDGGDGASTAASAEVLPVVAAAPASVAAEGQQAEVVVSSTFSGLTDLQHSLLSCLWRGHYEMDSSQPPPRPQPPDSIDGALAAEDAGHGSSTMSSSRTKTGGSSISPGWPVRRTFLQMVAQSAADAAAPRSPPLEPEALLHRLVNMNCHGENFQVSRMGDVYVCVFHYMSDRA